MKEKVCPFCGKKQPRFALFHKAAIYFSIFFGLIIIGIIVFPTGDDGKTIIPNWFYPFCYLFPAVVAIFYDTPIFKRLLAIRRKKYDDPLGKKYHKSDAEVDALYAQAVNVIVETGCASGTMLQKRLSISWDNAQRLLSKMELDGIIGPPMGSAPRKILISKNGLYGGKRKSAQVTSIEEVDTMEGHQFEYWCADLLQRIGFMNVEVTQGSGDQGVDILAVKDGIKYAIQCKCYASDLGNKPIQEVHTGKAIYHCQIGAVMTNRHFTQGGIKAAEATGVLLWGRDWIQAKLKEIYG